MSRNRPTSPEFWRMAGGSRWLPWKLSRTQFLTALVTFALGLAAWIGLPWAYSSPSNDNEIAVLFPSSDVTAWPDFVCGVRLAAQAKNLTIKEDTDRHSCVVMTQPRPTRFQWYPVIGSFALQRQVKELCRRPNPPLAIIGANNTSLTQAIGAEVRSASRADWIPLLLMTQATTDELIDVNPGRSFRFGFNNSYQAKAVVNEFQSMLQALPRSSSTVQAIVVQVADNPFSVDLASHFIRELQQNLQATILSDPRSPALSPSSPWILRTASSRSEGAAPEEKALAERIVQAFAQKPDAPAAVVLPTDLDTTRHLVQAIHDEKKRQSFTEQIFILSGDSLDYYDVAQGMSASTMPGPLVFFSHVNPIDRSIFNAPESHWPAVGLDRDVAQTLLSAVTQLGDRPTPDQLAAALSDPDRMDERVFFNDFERAIGGGALVATAAPMGDRFDIRLPQAWVKSP
jgi:hypothetical protein